MNRGALVAAVSLTLALATSAAGQAQRPAPPAHGKNDYGRAESWLCRPDARHGACEIDLSATAVAADGSLTRESWAADPDPPIDCFYVYPTVSSDPTPNSDMVPGPEERRAVAQQFARLGSACRLYVPLYRQMTLTALAAGLAGKLVPVDRVLAYNDVVDAWRHYLEHDNRGRGVVLVGHSQGAQLLTQLIRSEVDGRPLQRQLVSAILPGSNVAVPKGRDAGGTFTSLPVCRSATQTGCVLAWVSFREDLPPPVNTMLGRVSASDREAACTNPGALGGGRAELRAYFPADARSTGRFTAGAWVAPPVPIATPFVALPGLLSAECRSNGQASFLAVSVHANPRDPRTDDIPGDSIANGQPQPNWGLHLVDFNLAMGNLVELVRGQAKAYTERRAP